MEVLIQELLVVMEDLLEVLVVEELLVQQLLEQEVLADPLVLVVMVVFSTALHFGLMEEAEELVKQVILMEMGTVEMEFHTAFLEQSIIGEEVVVELPDILVL